MGSNNKIDFEKSVKQFTGCETHTFDFTLKKPFIGDQYAIFHPWGLGLDDGGEVMKSMETIYKELGHQGRTIDVLKIDCEVRLLRFCFLLHADVSKCSRVMINTALTTYICFLT